MKRLLTPLNIVFATELIAVALISMGLVPREVILGVTGLIIFYMLFSPPEDSLSLTIMSIPLFVALPISDSFDSMANWRILIVVLFFCLFFKKGISAFIAKDSSGRYVIKEKFKHYGLEYLLLWFFVIAALSILVASYKILAIKKLLFLGNILVLFVIIRNLARSKEAIFKIIKSAAVGAIAVIGVSLIQLLVTLFVPLYNFWQFWAGRVILAFYGRNLSQLLSYSNTWFSYFSNSPPILRVFSVFPDSHSLAMFSILSLPVFLALAVYFNDQKPKKIFFWTMSVLALLGAVLSGSRGVWLSFIPVLAAAVLLYFKKINRYLTKKVMSGLLLFVAVFLLSSFYAPLYYKAQSLQGNMDEEALNLFNRARSISDLDELSNKTRLEIWGASIKSILGHPLLGVGLGNYITVLNEDASAAKQGASAHNLYLDFTTEIGILGGLLLILIFAEILRTSWLISKRAEEQYFKIFGLAFSLYFLWAMIYSLFDVVLLNDKVLMFFVVGAGILYSIRGISPEIKKIKNGL
jgi:O-antigen ligase